MQVSQGTCYCQEKVFFPVSKFHLNQWRSEGTNLQSRDLFIYFFYDPGASANPGVDCGIRELTVFAHLLCAYYLTYPKVADVTLHLRSWVLKGSQSEQRT